MVISSFMTNSRLVISLYSCHLTVKKNVDANVIESTPRNASVTLTHTNADIYNLIIIFNLIYFILFIKQASKGTFSALKPVLSANMISEKAATICFK